MTPPLGVRWTIGDVNPAGFEALRLSIWGAHRLFGPGARYAVCVNTLPADEARRRTGPLPDAIEWRDCTQQVPAFLRPHLEGGMAEGVAWKFAPVRLFADRFELSFDNDCVLWDWPDALREWLARGEHDPTGARCLIAEDVRRAFGQFDDLCGPRPINLGIRGLPPNFDHEAAMRAMLARRQVLLRSELDEQGLQAAAIVQHGTPLFVTTDEVSICSPFPPHVPHLGRCGAHFVGINTRRVWCEVDHRPINEHIREHWDRCRPALLARVRPSG